MGRTPNLFHREGLPVAVLDVLDAYSPMWLTTLEVVGLVQDTRPGTREDAIRRALLRVGYTDGRFVEQRVIRGAGRYIADHRSLPVEYRIKEGTEWLSAISGTTSK